jgi:sRNA-binding protein
MNMGYRYTLDERDDVVYDLIDKYPKCFFEKPQSRLPLKNTIMADLEEDCFPAEYELLLMAVEWYKSHYSYQYALETGAKRIDLNGKVVGTVTALEHANAQKKIAADKQKYHERIAAYKTPPVIPMTKPPPTPPPSPSVVVATPPTPATPASAPIIAPQMIRMYETLMTANAVFLGSGDTTLKMVMANAVLKILVQEAQRIIEEVESVRTEPDTAKRVA